MKKTYVLDTNVLLSDPNALFSFEEHEVVLPMIVMEELDRHKDRQDEVGRNARETARKLSGLTKDHKEFNTAIPLGEKLGTLRILSFNSLGFSDIKSLIPSELEGKSGDNQILAVCTAFQKKYPEVEMSLVSRDVLLRLKANALGVPSDDYRKMHVAKSVSGLYTGVSSLVGDYDLETFYREGTLELPEAAEADLHTNQFLIVKKEGTESSALMRYKGKGKGVQKINEYSPCKIDARNKEQKFALDLLLDPSIPLVTVVGSAGTGKTLLAIASGLHQVIDTKKYKSLIVCRPIQPLGKDIGFLPGTMEEKMEPWVAPIKDNLRYLLSADGKKSKRGEETMAMLFENGTIEVEAMTFIRGRSIANAYMIIDEAQNLNAHELKTIITRAGEGTKIVLTGDIEQIDNMYVDSVSNGLTVAIEKFKSYGLSGHVTLTKGERSALATLAASIL
jgi:PhoH-like ATPase